MTNSSPRRTRAGRAAPFAGRLFHRVDRIVIGGQQWSLAMSTTPKFDQASLRRGPALIVTGGTLLSALLAGLVFTLGVGRARAQALAEKMTASLRDSEAEARRLAASAGRNEQRLIAPDHPGARRNFPVRSDARRPPVVCLSQRRLLGAVRPRSRGRAGALGGPADDRVSGGSGGGAGQPRGRHSRNPGLGSGLPDFAAGPESALDSRALGGWCASRMP